jgi:hypothetical protein
MEFTSQFAHLHGFECKYLQTKIKTSNLYIEKSKKNSENFQNHQPFMSKSPKNSHSKANQIKPWAM